MEVLDIIILESDEFFVIIFCEKKRIFLRGDVENIKN